MKKRIVLKKTLAVCLTLLLVLNIFLPITAVRSEAAESSIPYVQVPAKTVGVSKLHAGATAAGAVFKGIDILVRGIGAFSYANENCTSGTSEEWLKLAGAYFSGNAGQNEQISDLKSAMVAEFDMTREAIAELSVQISTLQSDVKKLSDDLSKLSDQTKAAELKARLDDFYTNFFEPAYTNLMNAYDAVDTTINSADSNAATVRMKMDDLYMAAAKMSELQSYITGKKFFDDQGILDVYFEYTLRAGSINDPSSTAYYNAVLQSQNFAMKLYSADALQRLCTAYTSSYQLMYYYEHRDEMISSGAFVGYIVQGTVSGSTNALTIGEIKNNISNADSGVDIVSSEIAKLLAEMYLLEHFVSYTESDATYYAPVSSGSAKVYNNATYGMYALQDDFGEIFSRDFAFVVTEGNANVSDTGVFTVDSAATATFKVSYVYGVDTLDTPIEIYSTTFTKATKTFAGGYGTEEAPYLISDISHLKAFASSSTYHASGVYVKLVANINDASSVAQIANYNGTFDGGEYTIYNRTSPLFNTNNGVIKNVTFSGINISISGAGSSFVGGIVNTNNGTMVNCHLKSSSIYNYRHNRSGHVVFYSEVGGIVATNTGILNACSVTGSIINAEISTRELYNDGNAFKAEDITSNTHIYVGGIAGENEGVIKNCYIGNSTVKSTTYATYYKWQFWWEHKYQRVAATINYGIITGYNSKDCSNNYYKDVNYQTHNVKPIANESEDSSFVTSSVNVGNHGSSTSTQPKYFTSISVNTKPYQTVYAANGKLNTAALEIVDNNNNPIYGYTVHAVSTATNGTKTVSVSYRGYSTTFDIMVGCGHDNVKYEDVIKATCITNGYSSAVFCEDCKTYISGHTVIEPNDSYCVDYDDNHLCDRCSRELSICKDESCDHYCDSCGVKVSECYDNDNHLCDLCKEKISDCADNTNDHNCDLCGERISECYDNDDHYCNICNTKISDCRDNDLNHNCDVCAEKISECYDNNNHYCDLCGEKITVCADEDFDHKCDVCSEKLSECEDTDNDHRCQMCDAVISDCVDADDHICDMCGAVASSCADNNRDHNCDLCGESISYCKDANKNHKCDVCEAVLSYCDDTDNDHICNYCNAKATSCVDNTNDHRCDICSLKISICVDTDDHACDVCGAILSTCKDYTNDHKCDVCGEVCSYCDDATNDHKCDLCGTKISFCEDNNSDHKCDTCGTRISACKDETDDHRCDTCSVKVSECYDADNHECDICGVVVSECADGNNDHKCDLCSDVCSYCYDKDNNHKCDVCDTVLSYCVDNTNDHICDMCGIKNSNCADGDNDHVCDMCGVKVSECYDADNHECDLCGAVVSECSDDNNDHNCDVCGSVYSYCHDDTADHNCDVCGTKVSSCDDSNADHRCELCNTVISSCKDENDDHNCDVCGIKISECSDNDNHKCDLCGAVVSECSDDNNDHNCDVCGDVYSYCHDDTADHNCDVCGTKVSSCDDSNADHRCELCNAVISSCKDENDDHNCDVCGIKISKCSDNDNHKCDKCGIVISGCTDTDKNHYCDLCSERSSYCDDATNDHKCDVCGVEITYCEDKTSDHNCDVCSKKISECKDEDNDHKCDLCDAKVSECSDRDNHFCDLCNAKISECSDNTSDHNCDLCGGKLSECVNNDKDRKCDVCGARMQSVLNTGIKVAIGVSAVAVPGLAIGTYFWFFRKKMSAD